MPPRPMRRMTWYSPISVPERSVPRFATSPASVPQLHLRPMQAIRAAQARYPEVKWDPASLEGVDTPYLDDLFIARAAAAHDTAAIAILEREVLPSLRS